MARMDAHFVVVALHPCPWRPPHACLPPRPRGAQYEVSDDQDSVQMLQRSSQVGEFYRMSPPAVFDDTERLPASYMDIMIYDEESDRHVHIPFLQAWYATGFGAANGEGPLDDVFGVVETVEASLAGGNVVPTSPLGRADAHETKFTGKAATTVSAAFTAMYNVLKPKGGGKPTLAQLNAGQKNFTTAISDAVATGIWVPLEIVIVRPFIEHLMMSAIVAVAGRETGATLFGPADMQISANTSVKTIEGHYTCDATTDSNLTFLPWDPCPAYTLEHNTPPAMDTRSRSAQPGGLRRTPWHRTPASQASCWHLLGRR